MFHQTKVLLNRAVKLERSGHWLSAIELCEKVYQRSIAEGDAANLVEALLRIGYSYQDLGETELATEYLELTVVLAELHDNYRTASRALNGLAILCQEHGELDAARNAYRQAREMALRAEDPLTAGTIDQNLGTLANIRGNLTEALAHYRSGLACYEQVAHPRGIAGVLNNLGMLHIDLRQFDEAAECLERALAVSRETGDVVTESIVHINRTELFLERGELEQARRSCDDAFEITSRLEDNSSQSEALKFYGVIAREAGEPQQAEEYLQRAIRLAVAHNYPLQEAEAQRELSLLLRLQGRNRESLTALNRSHALFSSLQARKDLADVSTRLGQLEEDFLYLVSLWGESIEAKDLYTRGHCQRVADYACRIAERAGFSEQDLFWFRMGAFLHDVGKTEVPEEILNKPGRLTDEERRVMERHTVFGDEILSTTEFPWDVRPVVRSHHERWDGNGYPDGLRGEEIPLSARILHIADVFDALTTTRSYRQPLPPERALQIMEDDHGSFDPKVFGIFLELYPELANLARDADSERIAPVR